jgi:hypothetical protein
MASFREWKWKTPKSSLYVRTLGPPLRLNIKKYVMFENWIHDGKSYTTGDLLLGHWCKNPDHNPPLHAKKTYASLCGFRGLAVYYVTVVVRGNTSERHNQTKGDTIIGVFRPICRLVPTRAWTRRFWLRLGLRTWTYTQGQWEDSTEDAFRSYLFRCKRRVFVILQKHVEDSRRKWTNKSIVKGRRKIK